MSTRRFIAASLVLLHLAPLSLGRTPEVTIADPDNGVKDAVVNDETILTCTVKRRTGRTVYWLHEAQGKFYDLAAGEVVYTPSKHAIIRSADYRRFWKLVIKHTSEDDAGTYYCRVWVTDTNFVQDQATLNIIERPVIDTAVSTLGMSIVEDEPVVLQCHAHGIPQPSVSWTRVGGKELPTGGPISMQSQLAIPHVRPDDRGDYICRARNRAGSDQLKVTLDVRFLPVITSEKPVYKQARGYEKELTCYVESNPDVREADLSWSKDGSQITGDSRRVVTFLRGAGHRVTWKLFIKKVEDGDYGTYTCSATTRRDGETKTRRLDVSLQVSSDYVHDAAQVLSRTAALLPSAAGMLTAGLALTLRHLLLF